MSEAVLFVAVQPRAHGFIPFPWERKAAADSLRDGLEEEEEEEEELEKGGWEQAGWRRDMREEGKDSMD